MTVNHDVAGSSPARGAKRKRAAYVALFPFGLMSLDGATRKSGTNNHPLEKCAADLL